MGFTPRTLTKTKSYVKIRRIMSPSVNIIKWQRAVNRIMQSHREAPECSLEHHDAFEDKSAPGYWLMRRLKHALFLGLLLYVLAAMFSEEFNLENPGSSRNLRVAGSNSSYNRNTADYSSDTDSGYGGMAAMALLPILLLAGSM